MAPTHLARRDTLRDANLRWTTPFCAARTMNGSASFKAAAATSLLPEAIASSTLRTELLRRVRTVLLTAVRQVVWRAAFFADFVLAMGWVLEARFDLRLRQRGLSLE